MIAYRLTGIDKVGRTLSFEAVEFQEAERKAQDWFDEHNTRPTLYYKLGENWVHWRYRLEHEREPPKPEPEITQPASDIEVVRVMPASLEENKQRFFSLSPGRQTMLLFSEGPLPSERDSRGRKLPTFRPGRAPASWPYQLRAPNHAGWLFGYDGSGYYAESTDGKSWRQITKQAYEKAVRADRVEE